MTPIQYLRDWIDNREAVEEEEKKRIYEARKVIYEAMRERFGDRLDKVTYSGSIAKDTAVRSSQDMYILQAERLRHSQANV